MPFRFLIACVVLAAGLLAGCSASSPMVATIGEEKMTLEEFENHYAKNNGGWDAGAKATPEERQKFLDLILKFRLKVKEARNQKLDSDSAVVSELETYRNTVAHSFMIDKELLTPGVRRMYDRKTKEVRASHILLRIAPTATPEETLAVYDRAVKIIAQIQTAPFDSLARTYSEDPSAAMNGGDLGYFSMGRMVPEFEDICFTLNPGEYTKQPFRTQFGYHIVKVIDRQKNPGAVQVAHILRRFAQDQSDTTAVSDTVDLIMKKLRGGMAFDAAAMEYSQDPGSAPKGGDIGMYERDRLPPMMAEPLFSAKVDSILEPFRMNYGFHILKVLSFKGIPTFEESERDIRTLYQQQRFPADQKALLERQKVKYVTVVNEPVVSELIMTIDTTRTAAFPGWSDTLSAEFRGKTIMTVGTRTVSVQSFVERVSADQELRNTLLTPVNIRMLVQKVSDVSVLENYARTYTAENKNFTDLMREYEEGILLYRVEQDEVWKKVVMNDSLLRIFHATVKESYRWPDRVNFAEIFVTSDSAAQAIYKRALKSSDFLALAETTTVRPGYKEKKGEWGFQSNTLNELSRKAAELDVDKIAEPMKFQYGWSIIKVLAKDSARAKTFEEASPEVATAYQEKASKDREQQWVDGLRAKYPVKVNADVLAKAFSGPAKSE